MEEVRYNPFKSYRYDKYSQPDNESFAEIHQIDTCKRYDIKELNNLLKTPSESNEQLSIMFKNKGSGLAIYLKETLLFTVSEEHNQCSPNLEALFITFNNTETPIMIGVAYRPPNGNKVQSLAELNSVLTKLPHSNVYLTGDFNIDLLGNLATELEDTVFVNGFNPLISIATHFKPSCKPSCISIYLLIPQTHWNPLVYLNHCPIFCISSANFKPCLSIPSFKNITHSNFL